MRPMALGIQGNVLVNEKGQAFDAFNLLIGAVVALTILVIILSAISYFDNKKLEVSQQKLSEGFRGAVKQPNGAPLGVNSILLAAGARISSLSVSREMGIAEECIGFEVNAPGLAKKSDSLVEVNERVLTDMTITCLTNKASGFPFPGGCEIGCTVTFGK